MIMTLTEHDFIELTNKYSQYKDNFSHQGKKALFEYLQEYEQDTGEQIEFDYIALCCDYTEWDNRKELLNYYSSAYNINSLDSLRDNTEIIEFRKYNIKEMKDNDYKSYIIRNF